MAANLTKLLIRKLGFFIEWACISNKTYGKEVSFIDISIHNQEKKTYPAAYMD